MKTLRINEIAIAVGTIAFLIPFFSGSAFSLLSGLSLIVMMLGINLFLLFHNFDAIVREDFKFITLSLLAILLLLIGTLINGTGAGSFLVMTNFYLTLLNSSAVVISHDFRKNLDKLLAVAYGMFMIIDKSFLNTNTIGYIIFILFLFAYDYSNFILKPRYKKIYIILLCTLTFVQIYATASRSVLLAFVTYLVLSILPKKIIAKGLLKAISICTLLFGSIVFAYIYVLKSYSTETVEIVGGKRVFSGRQEIWSEVIRLFSNEYWFGIGSRVKLTSFGSFNIHNSMLNILVVYGVINFLIVCLLLGSRINSAFSKLNIRDYAPNMVFALVSLFIVAFFETNLVWPSVSFYLLLVFCYINIDKDKALK